MEGKREEEQEQLMIKQIRLGISNVFLLQAEKAILVDTGNPGDLGKLLKALQDVGVEPHDLSLILQTHGHADHCGNTDALRKLSGAPVAIHSADAAMLRRGHNGPLLPTSLSARVIRMLIQHKFAGVEADILIAYEAMDLTPYGFNGKIIFTPGHTAGSISIMTETRELIVGDILMGGYMGGAFLPGRPGYHYFADDLAEVRRSIQKVLRYAPTKVYVGHGGPLDPAAIWRAFLPSDGG